MAADRLTEADVRGMMLTWQTIESYAGGDRQA